MIELRGIKKSFGDPPTNVLKGITAEIKGGEMVSIVGRSGSGKSTLLYIVSTLDKPTEGEVVIDGVPVRSLSVKELHQFRNEKMGFVFQFHHLLPELSALENVLMPTLKAKTKKDFHPLALELLAEFGLATKRDRLPGQLSGGEQQRVAIARALIMEPRYLFADEPTGNLDSANGEAVLHFFQNIHKERGTTVIYVTHDPLFAELADRELVLVDGMIKGELHPDHTHTIHLDQVSGMHIHPH
jgi:ABC-type lipoprotein export system ATPase subunit